jgi:C4-type Zn-finger protein
MKTLSKAAKKRHVSSGGDSECPFCKADYSQLNYEEPEPMADGVIEQQAQCEACSAKWVDVYQLKQVYAIDSETGARY